MSQNKDQALAMTAAQMLGVFACAFIWVSFTLTAKCVVPPLCAAASLCVCGCRSLFWTLPADRPTALVRSLTQLTIHPNKNHNNTKNRTPDLSVLWEPTNIAALVYTGIITSALAVVAESVALAHVSAEETTVILRYVRCGCVRGWVRGCVSLRGASGSRGWMEDPTAPD